MPRLLILPALALALSTVVGCSSSYVLEGKVVEGGFADVLFVPADDPQISDPGPGIGGASISVYRDPDSLGRKLAARGQSDSRGRVSIPIEAFGTGWMEEQWMIQVVRQNYETLELLVNLPSASKDRRALIVLTRGHSIAPRPDKELLEQFEQYR